MRKLNFKLLFIVFALLLVLTACDSGAHTHTEVIDEGKAATCTETGLTMGIHCSTCNEVLVKQEVIPVTDHDYKAATCEEPATCKICGATNGETLEHEFGDWYKTSSTEEKRDCGNCSHSETRTVTEVHTHSYGAWQVKTPAGCMTAGEERRTCSCGQYESRAINATGHNFGEWTKVSDSEEKRVCGTCSHTESRTVSATHTHSYGSWQLTTTPGCMTAGEERSYCSCGHFQSRPVNATGHNYGDWKVFKAATCTTTGEERRTCTCGLFESRIINTIAHNYVGGTCSSCGGAETTTPEHTHSYGDWQVTTKATCTTPGEEKRTCSCGLAETRTINATGHSFGEWTKVSDTEEKRTCACGETETRTVTADHTHSYGDWQVTTKATCTTPGEEKRTCSCGLAETRTINATGHTFGAWQVTTKATCTTDGEEKRTCACGEAETKAISATGHTYVSGKCSSCGATDPNYVAPNPGNATYAEAFAAVSSNLLADFTTFFGTEVTKENCTNIFYKNRENADLTVAAFFLTNSTYSSKWSWLKDFFVTNGNTPDQLTAGTEAFWRFEVQSFLNETVATTWPRSADYSSQAIQSAFTTAYNNANGSTGGGNQGGGSTESNPLLDADLAAITLPATLTSNYTYTNKGANGTSFQYISSNAGVLSDEGVVTRMLYDVEVTVRIIGTLNGAEKEKSVKVKVLQYELPEKSHQIILDADDLSAKNDTANFVVSNGAVELAPGVTSAKFLITEEQGINTPYAFSSLVASWGATNTSANAYVNVRICLKVNGAWSNWVSYVNINSNANNGWGFGKSNGSYDMTDSTGRIKISCDEVLCVSGTATAIQYEVRLTRTSATVASPKFKYLSLTPKYTSGYSYPVNRNHLPTSVYHSVPLLYQVAVPSIGSVICSATTSTMMLKYYGIDFSNCGYTYHHEYVARKVVYDTNYGYGNWVYNTVGMSHYGFKSYVARFFSMEELMYQLTKGPVGLSIAVCTMTQYEGYKTYTHSGHLILAVGYKYINGQLYITCNDPYVQQGTCNYSETLIKTYWKFVGYVIEK